MAAPGTIDRAQHSGAGELDTARWLPLSGHAIDAILDIDDLAMRNLWITQGWANLAGRLGRFFGVDHTWCTFAVWTSSTAGRTIRSGQLISEAVSVVDTAVFRQIAPLFTGLAERLELGDVHPDDGAAVLRALGLDPTSPEPPVSSVSPLRRGSGRSGGDQPSPAHVRCQRAGRVGVPTAAAGCGCCGRTTQRALRVDGPSHAGGRHPRRARRHSAPRWSDVPACASPRSPTSTPSMCWLGGIGPAVLASGVASPTGPIRPSGCRSR